MKKLFLGIAALAVVLSPSLSAQSTSELRLHGWLEDNPTLQFGNQMKAAAEKFSDDTKAMPASELVLTTSELKNLPSKENHSNWDFPTSSNLTNGAIGYGLYTDGLVNLTFDYSAVILDYYDIDTYGNFANSHLSNSTWGYSTNYVAESDDKRLAGLDVYPGVAMTFSTPGKRLKKVIIHTGLGTSSTGGVIWYMNEFKMNSNLFVDDSNVTMKWVDNDGLVDIVLTAADLFGRDGGITLKTKPFFNGKSWNNTIPLNLATTPGSNARYKSLDAPTLNIKSVEVEYYDEAPFTQKDTYKINTTGNFRYYKDNQLTNVTGAVWQSKVANKIEKVMIGDVIIEIDGANTPCNYSMYLQTTQGLGLFNGTKFRMYLDPEKHKNSDGSPIPVYSFKVRTTSGTNSYNKPNALNAKAINLGAVFDGAISIPAVTTTASDPIPDYIFEAVNEDGITSDNGWLTISATTWYNPTTTMNVGNLQSSATVPVIYINEIEVKTPIEGEPAPGVGSITAVGASQEDGKYKFIGKATVTPTVADDAYPNHAFYYIKGDADLTKATFNKAGAAKINPGESIEIDSECTLSILTVGVYSKGEVEGEVANYCFKPFDVALYDNIAALKAGAHDGDLVALNCLVNLIQNGVYGKAFNKTGFGSASNGYLFLRYARDIYGDAIKFTGFTNATDISKDATHPLNIASNSFQSQARTFIGPAALVGRYFSNNGHPEIRIIDEKSDEKYDYTAFANTTTVATGDAAAKQMSGMDESEQIFGDYPLFVDKPSAENWGKLVRIKGLKFSDFVTPGYYYKFSNEDAPTVKFLFNGYPIVAKTGAAAQKSALTAGDSYTVFGIVEYDETDGYYLGPTYILSSVQPPLFTDATAANNSSIDGGNIRAEIEDGVDVAVDVNLLGGKIKFNFVRNPKNPMPNGSVATTSSNYYYEIRDLNNPGTVLTTPLVANSAQKQAYELGYGYLTWDDNGAATVEISAVHVYGSGYDIADRSEPVVVKIYDTVAAGMETQTLQQMLADYKDKTAAEIGSEEFVTITVAGAANEVENGYGRLAVIGKYGNYILVRDIPEGMTAGDEKFIDATVEAGEEEADEQPGFTGFNGMLFIKDEDLWADFKVTDNFGPTQGTSHQKPLLVGEAIKKITARVTLDANGNLILDATGAGSRFQAIKSNVDGKPRMLAELPQLLTPESRELAELTADDLYKLVRISDVALNDDYSIGGSNLILAWNYIGDEATRNANQHLIAGAPSDIRFAVTGIVMHGADGKLAIEVMNLECGFNKEVEVCEHSQHATYFKNHEFGSDDKLVRIKGVRISRSGSEYSIELKNTVNLDWTTATMRAATDKAAIDAVLIDGKTTKEFIVAGILSDDGTTLDVVNLDPVESLTYPLYIASRFVRGEMFSQRFNSVTTPIFLYNPKNYQTQSFYYDATEAYTISYKMVRESEVEGGIPADTEARRQLLAAKELVEFNPATFEPIDETVLIYAEVCGHGNKSVPASLLTVLEKSAKKVKTIAELTSTEKLYGAYHYVGGLRVLEVGSADNRLLVLTDGKDIINARVSHEDEFTEDITRGAVIGNVVMTPIYRGQFYNINFNEFDHQLVPLHPLDDVTIDGIPAQVALTGEQTIEEVESKAVKVVGSSIADVANDHVMTIGNMEFPVTTHLGWVPEDVLRDDDDTQYNLSGYLFRRVDPATGEALGSTESQPEYRSESQPEMPAAVPTAVAQAAVQAGDYTHEIWITGIVVREKTESPVIIVTGAESNVDGKAVTTEPVKIEISAIEGATIEFSTDGGSTWQSYGDPLTFNSSATLLARAVIGDMRYSEPVEQSVVYEYYSGDIAIASVAMPGYTEVRIAPTDKNLADDTYEIRYTLDGSVPTADSPVYDAPLELETVGVVRAALFEVGKRPGEEAQERVEKIVSGDVKVSVRDDADGTHIALAPASTAHLAATYRIHYTIDGTMPTAESPLYSDEIHIADDVTVMAYLIEQGKSAGEIVMAAVTGVDRVGADADDAAAVKVEGNTIVAPEGSMIFDIAGRRVKSEGLRPGIYIVRLPGGKAVKVAVN